MKKREESKETPIISLVDLAILAVFGVLISMFFKFVISPGTIPSESMEPTLMTGDWVLVNRVSYLFKDPQRGDIVTFYPEENEEILIKRIIGLPGDEISFAEGYVYVNDARLYEDYIDDSVKTCCEEEFNVPADCYFVLGDNRENSLDSRFMHNPYVARDDIKGKFLCVIKRKIKQ